MGLDKRSYTLTIPSGTTATTTANLKWDFAELIQAKVRLTGTDTATSFRITDGDSRVVFSDVADRDYKTADVILLPAPDATGTGTASLSTTHVDATGAALTIGLGASSAAVKNPLTLTMLNDGTATDTIAVELAYRELQRASTSLTVPNPAATVTGTLGLRSKFAQIVGFSALLTGTDTAVRIGIKDADNVTVYLDAADRDYKTAKVHILYQTDDTTTGLTALAVDSSGAAPTATAGAQHPVVKSPLTLSVINGGTAGDVVAIDVFYRNS